MPSFFSKSRNDPDSTIQKNEKEKPWSWMIGTERPFWLIVALLINGFFILYTVKIVLQTFPLSPDEYAYQISAQLFSEAKLSVPSPQAHWFFQTLNFVNNGAYYGKYPPGWPLLLAMGTHIGLAWLVNPLFALLTLVVIFILGRTFFSPAVANLTMILTLGCPYFIYNSSCFLSHPSCLLFLTLAAYFLLNPEHNFKSFMGFGMTAGFAFLIRPYTAFLFLTPLVLYFLVCTFRERNWLVLRKLGLGALPIFGIFLGLFMLYNYAQTGHPLVQPFEICNPEDHLGFYEHTWKEYSDRFYQKILGRVGDWIIWTSGTPLLVLFFLIRGKISNSAYQMGLLLSLPALCLLTGYFFYHGSGIFQYGPRYLYESYALMLIPAAIGLLAARRLAPWFLILILFFNVITFAVETPGYKKLANDHVQFFNQVHKLSNAIVFVHSPDVINERYYLRNGVDFNGPVLLVADCGPHDNQELISHYPGRALYRCDFDTTDWDKILKPYKK